MKKNYYHIQRIGVYRANRPYYKVGDIVKTNDFNPYFEYYNSYIHPNLTVNLNTPEEFQLSRLKMLEAVSSSSITMKDQVEVAKIGELIAQHFITYTRELVFEAVRAEKFPHLPSRQKCIWVVDSLDGLKHWKSRLPPASGYDIEVFKVDIQGNIHSASEEHLLYGEFLHSEMIDAANKYWNGTISETIRKETLFEGEMRILEKIQ